MNELQRRTAGRWRVLESGIDRRAFLGSVVGAGLGVFGLAACAGAGTVDGGGRRLDRIGVQLYTVRDRMGRDVPGTLRAVAEVGFREVETAGLFDLPPTQFRAELDRAGLVSPAGHYPVDALRQDLAATLDTARTLGQTWVVVPWLAEPERTVAGYRRLAEQLNQFGAAAQQQELRIGYHNHEFEFEPLDGDQTGFDLLLRETDPALVDVELDLFWAVRGGRDPVALFAEYPGRFPLCHVKDMAGIGGAQRMVEVGRGEIDFAGIFAHAEQAGLRHYFVEHDEPSDSLASIRVGYEHLRQLTF